jgi:hypothetical protein
MNPNNTTIDGSPDRENNIGWDFRPPQAPHTTLVAGDTSSKPALVPVKIDGVLLANGVQPRNLFFAQIPSSSAQVLAQLLLVTGQ